MSDKVQATLPPCTLVLHSPWMNGANDEYIGVVTDATLLQCTYAAELNEEVPVLTDRFVSFTSDEDAYWVKRAPNTIDRALSTEYPTEHAHDLSHSHSANGLASQAQYSSKIDRNNTGTPDYHVAPLHSHDVTLDQEALGASEENDKNSYEPLHY